MRFGNSTIFIPVLLISAADFSLASHRYHAHGHRARNHHLRHGPMMQARAIASTQTHHMPEETVFETQTLTRTVLEDCATTNPILATTTPLEEWTPAQESKPAKPAPASAESTTESTITIHITSTITETITVTASASTTTSSSKAPMKKLPVHGPAEQNDAARTIPSLDNLPDDISQLLPGIVPGLPIPNIPLDQVLHPNGVNQPSSIQWTSVPQNGVFSLAGFGDRSEPHGTRVKYHGNVGVPWGSNIITVSPSQAHNYKYVVKFRGSNTEPWTITIWNKVGPDGEMDGWYGHAAESFILAPGETRYVAFDEDSEGAWGAAPGTNGLPKDSWGGFTSTWGEFSFGDQENNGWSGWDVSAIQAQVAHQDVQGMRICEADGKGCSVITPQAGKVIDAYTEDKKHHDGIGGAAAPGPVRLVVDVDYQG